MNTLGEILRGADPLLLEPAPSECERARVRHSVVAAALVTRDVSSGWIGSPAALLAAVVLAMALAIAGPHVWPRERTTLHAAVRFEVRLAEDRRQPDLREARITGTGRPIYLHEPVIVTNADIAGSTLMAENAPSRFGVVVQFTPAGSRKMREATAGHVGKPVAILIDGEVVSAPIVRGPIGESAVVSGAYTRADAERILNGIRR